MPNSAPHLPRHPRVVVGCAGPSALVQPAEDKQVGLLQAGLEQPPDGKPRVPSVSRADDIAGAQCLEQARIVPAGQRRKIPGSVDQLVTEARRRLACGFAPKPLASGLRRRCRQPLGSPDMGGDEARKRGRIGGEQIGQWAEASLEPIDIPPESPGRMSKRRSQAGKTRRRPRAQDRPLEAAGELAERNWGETPAASGCFSAASSGTGASRSAARSSTSRKKTPGGVLLSGSPAESSISISQRRSSAATRRASSRSGVTSAAVAPGVSSLRRSSSAMVTASCWALAQS